MVVISLAKFSEKFAVVEGVNGLDAIPPPNLGETVLASN